MFTLIGADEFEAMATGKSRPVLLAYINFDSGHKQMRILEKVFLKYFGDELLKVFLLKEEFITQQQLNNLGILGTPEFILFYDEKEIGRKLGLVDEESLKSFLLQRILKITREKAKGVLKNYVRSSSN